MILESNDSQRIRVGGRWELTLPRDWTFQRVRHSTALFKVNGGVGAINVSSMRISSHAHSDPIELVGNFASGLKLTPTGDFGPVTAQQPHVSAAERIFEKGETRWLVHGVVSDKSALVLTYNCRLVVWDQEQDDVRRVIASILDDDFHG
jgi:hypothetical protein